MRTFAVFLLLSCCLCSLTPAWALQWSAVRVQGATIYVPAGDRALAQRLAVLARDDIPALAQIIGVENPGTFPIYAFTSWSDFLTATGLNPDLLGESISPSGTILLYVTGDDYTVQKTLAHELTHSLLGQRLGHHLGELPTWVNEGLACYLSDPLTPEQFPAVSRQLHHNGILSLEQLDRAFVSTGSHDAAYLQSRSMVAWLEYHHPGALRHFIDDLADGKSFESALNYAAGLSPDGWWNGWEGGIPAYIYWFTLLMPQAIFTLMALLVLLAALLRALRKRHEAQEEEEEDEEEDEDEEAIEHTQTAEKNINGERTQTQHAGRYNPGYLNDDLLEDQ